MSTIAGIDLGTTFSALAQRVFTLSGAAMYRCVILSGSKASSLDAHENIMEASKADKRIIEDLIGSGFKIFRMNQ